MLDVPLAAVVELVQPGVLALVTSLDSATSKMGHMHYGPGSPLNYPSISKKQNSHLSVHSAQCITLHFTVSAELVS